MTYHVSFARRKTPSAFFAQTNRHIEHTLWHLIAIGALGVLASCADKTPTSPAIKPEMVVRQWQQSCPTEVTTTTTDSTETLLFSFTTFGTSCYPELAKYGVDMADPMGVDTPQGTATWTIKTHAGYYPNNGHVAEHFGTPPRNFIEFDPPIRSVELHYTRPFGAAAYWNGVPGPSDSMLVSARSRLPGTLFYNVYDQKKLRSNWVVPNAAVWDSVRLTAYGDVIEWLWFDGQVVIDNMRVTRAKQDTTFH